ncbi:hypothetical protein EMCRGX_G010446 [Ephydatia muelleri]
MSMATVTLILVTNTLWRSEGSEPICRVLKGCIQEVESIKDYPKEMEDYCTLAMMHSKLEEVTKLKKTFIRCKACIVDFLETSFKSL